MKIAGLQRLTILDYPEHTACIVFTAGCNFRCWYCHNQDLLEDKKPIAELQEFYEWLATRKNKLDGVVITGGEPTLQLHLLDFIDRIKSMGFLVKLDTNGSHPFTIHKAIEYGVDYIAMDIKSSLPKYSDITGRQYDWDCIRESVRIIMDSAKDYEFRTTVNIHDHCEQDFHEIGKLIEGAKRYYLQKCSINSPDNAVLMKYRRIMEHYVDYVEIRGYLGI